MAALHVDLEPPTGGDDGAGRAGATVILHAEVPLPFAVPPDRLRGRGGVQLVLQSYRFGGYSTPMIAA